MSSSRSDNPASSQPGDAAVDAPRVPQGRVRMESDIRELVHPRGRMAEAEEALEESAAPRSSLAPDAAARRIVSALVERGVCAFFGIPGGPVAPLFEAIRLEPRARLIESRHEAAAALAAAMYHRASGRVPALVVTAGPGITNAVTGIASAHLERAPMLVITGDVAWAAHGARLAQDSGPEGIAVEHMLQRCTRAQLRVAKAASAATQALSALDAATDPLNPGPALLVLPIDHATRPAPPPQHSRGAIGYEMRLPLDAVYTAARWLAEAERPLCVIGGGCRGHGDALRALLDVLGVPFVTTPRAKGLVSEAHPRSLRNGGMAASLWARRYTAEPVDVALVLGTDLDDTSMGPTPYLGCEGKLIHVDLDPSVFHRNLPTALAVQADLGAFACELACVVASEGLHNPRGSALARQARAASPFDVPDFATDSRMPIAPHRAVADLERAAGPRARFIADIGEHMLFCLHYLTAAVPSSFHIQLALGSMGSGIAGAVGLALADPGRRVVCICGDGGMQMLGMEALVALRERLPIVFAVFNDARYNMVHHGMKQLFGEADDWSTRRLDFCAWASALGIPSAPITGPGEISARLLDELTAYGGPAVLDIRIDRELRIRGGGRVEALQHMSMLDGGAVL